MIEQARKQARGQSYGPAHETASDAEDFIGGNYRSHHEVIDGDLYITYRTLGNSPYTWTTTVVDFEDGNVVSVITRPAMDDEEMKGNKKRCC